MEENVALDSSKQKQFVKNIKGIKKLLQGQGLPGGLKKKDTDNVKIGRVRKPRHKPRGLVYLSHIPHGFYEQQMTDYFKQFGVVTNARVIRSKRTGMSKGHAFVEFKDPNVAEIVAETMNNYLMGKRLIKAAVVPPEKQRRLAKRKNWNAQNNPGNDLRQKMKKAHNAVKDENEELKNARRLLSNLSKTKQKLRELDVDYDFFTPVDIPESLVHLVNVKKQVDIKSENPKEKNPKVKVKQEEVEEKVNRKTKKNKKKKGSEIEVKDEDAKPAKPTEMSANKKTKTQPKDTKHEKKDVKTPTVSNKTVTRADKNSTKQTKTSQDDAKNKKPGKEGKVNKIQQQKEQKLKDAGVKPPEDFIQIQKDSDDDESDSSMNFDSDEYDKIMEQDSDIQSDDESEESDEDTEDDESDEEEAPTPPKAKGRQTQKVEVNLSKKQGKKPNSNKSPPQQMKRMNRTEAKPTKKPKFEKKNNKKTLNKVIKKKK